MGGERQSKITVSDLVFIDGAFFALLAWLLFWPCFSWSVAMFLRIHCFYLETIGGCDARFE
ncbi:hypothetical protein UMZ34_13805 [Halopseudomonas pachastrellae]|nr:hypothetical protein UMZ34_13805 [Halopseudomonas pachastrellae]